MINSIQTRFYPLYIFKLCIIYVFLFKSQQIAAQNISPVTQNIGGSIGSQANYSLTYSVGEMISIVNYVAQDKSSLNTGFLQSYTPLVTDINELIFIKPGNVIITPNPVVDIMHLNAKFLKPGQFEFNIIDASSNLKYKSIPYTINGYLNTELAMQNYSTGVYYVRVVFKPTYGHPEYGIYKLIKL